MEVGNLHSGGCLTWPCIKRRLLRRRRRKKNFHSVYLKGVSFLQSVVSRGRGRTVEGSENSHFRQAASLWMREESRKVHLQFLSISDRLQTVSERLRACSSCACTQNGAESADYSGRVTARGANDDEEPHPASQLPWLIKYEDPPSPPPRRRPPHPSVDSALNKTTVWVRQFIALRCGSLTAAYSLWEN